MSKIYEALPHIAFSLATFIGVSNRHTLVEENNQLTAALHNERLYSSGLRTEFITKRNDYENLFNQCKSLISDNQKLLQELESFKNVNQDLRELLKVRNNVK